VRPVYVASVWTPNATATSTHAGMSIATRATLADLDSGTPTDIFDQGTERGVTFRFYQPDAFAANDNIANTTGRANTISILSSDAAPVTSGADTYQLINGATYLIEAYDSGTDVWMRITQRDDAANTAVVHTSTTEDSLDGEQRVVFINDFDTGGTTSVSYIDDLVVGLPMLALETGPAAGIARTAAAANGTTADGNLTLEAWVKAKSLPAAGERSAIISQWDTTGGNGDQSFRLYLDGDNEGKLAFDIGTSAGVTPNVESFGLGFIPALEAWSHVAVTFDNTNNRVRFYLNGELSRTASSSAAATTGVRQAQEPLSVGASLANATTADDFFDGNISDVRVWSSVRAAAEVRDNFQRRLSVAGSESASGLVVNWVFDRESGTVGEDQDVQAAPSSAADGQLTDAAYVPVLAQYYRPLSTSFCPAGTRVGPYQCDFRTSSTSGLTSSLTIPNNLVGVYAKVWGAGGGGYDNTGFTYDTGAGSGGFSQGLMQSINGTSIAGQLLDVYVGGGGTGNSDNAHGAGGGGGSGIYTTGGNAGLVAGGGGGASYSLHNVDPGGDCQDLIDATRCGLGGLGGGAGGVALTTRAPDQSSSCGGRGGDNDPTAAGSPPSTNGNCADGGGDPVGRTGGGGVEGGAGGGPVFLAGGAGYNGDTEGDDGSPPGNVLGGGGGGGGAVGGEAGGFRDQANRRGWGGGGGSGTADGAGVLNVDGQVGVLAGEEFADDSREGNKTNGSAVVIEIDPDLTGAGWEVGYAIIGTGIPTGTTIQSIDSATQITMSQAATNSSTVVLRVISIGVPGGASDPYYSPSYLGAALQNPGRGGVVANPADGRGGAIVLLW